MDNLRIYVKFQKSLKDEVNSNSSWKKEGNNLTNLKTNDTYSFNCILDENKSNEEIYKEHLKSFINDSLIKAQNFSIFTYGQSLNKLNFIKSTEENVGIIFPMIKDIFSYYQNEYKLELKISIFDIYNEMVTDLLDSKKSNLDIKEFEKKLVIEHLTEATVLSSERFISLIKQSDKLSKILLDNRSVLCNESTSKFTSTIYKLSLDYSKKSDKKQSTNLQIYIVDFPNSDTLNLNRKNDITNTPKRQNQSKSINTFVNVINKLSQGQKANFTFRESKLTKVLYQNFNNMFSNLYNKFFFCCVNQNSDTNETVNVINFANKLKSLSSKKNNESALNISNIFEERSENEKLKSKIKELENIVNEQESIEKRESIDKKESNLVEMIQKNQTKRYTNDEEIEIKNNEMLSNLEKEVFNLKKVLMNNPNVSFIQEDNETPDEANCIENSFHVLNSSFSAKKSKINGYNKIPDSARKYNTNNENKSPYNNLYSSNSKMSNPSLSQQRRCYTESKSFGNLSLLPKFLIPQSINFSNQKQNLNNNFINFNNSYHNIIPDHNEIITNDIENRDFTMHDMHDADVDIKNDYIQEVIRERDELKRQITELKMGYLEFSREKENKIKTLSMNYSLKMENCDKMIQETEENYSNLKMQYDRVKEESLKKDSNISSLIQKVRNLESDLSLHINQSNLNPNEAIKELQGQLNDVNDSLEKTLFSLNQEIEKNSQYTIIIEKLRDENSNLKTSIDNMKNELMRLNTHKEMYFKNNEIFMNESLRMKNDIISYKNEILLNKEKITQQKNETITLRSEIAKLKNQNDNNMKNNKIDVKPFKLNNDFITCSNCSNKDKNIFILEDNIRSLEETIIEKNMIINNYENNSNTIKEYEKLIEDSLSKLKDLENNLVISQEKNRYLENILSKLNFTLEDEGKKSGNKKKTQFIKNLKSFDFSSANQYDENDALEETKQDIYFINKKRSSVLDDKMNGKIKEVNIELNLE